MKKEDVLGRLQDAGFVLSEEKTLPYGVQFCFNNGAKVSVYDKGKITPQGKCVEEVKRVLGLSVQINSNNNEVSQQTLPKRKKVFVVYGHDSGARTQLEAMLRRWDLDPLILDQLPSEGATIIEKLERYTQDVNFAVVLATPDDIGYRVNHEDELASRARQNVVFEHGLLIGLYSRHRVTCLVKKEDEIELPGDISGVVYTNHSVKDWRISVAHMLNDVGYKIDYRKII